MSMAQRSVVFGLPRIAVVKWTAFQRACRLVVLCPTTGFMYWTVVWSLYLLVLLGSFSLRVLGLGGGMLGVAVWRGSALWRDRLALRGAGCSAPVSRHFARAMVVVLLCGGRNIQLRYA